MKIDIKIEKKERKTNDDEKNLFSLKMSTYKQTIEGDFDFSELRELIEVIDNAIYQS